MKQVVLTEEMINDMVMKEIECGTQIDDKRELIALSDMITDLESKIAMEYYRKGFEAGFNECQKLIGGGYGITLIYTPKERAA